MSCYYQPISRKLLNLCVVHAHAINNVVTIGHCVYLALDNGKLISIYRRTVQTLLFLCNDLINLFIPPFGQQSNPCYAGTAIFSPIYHPINNHQSHLPRDQKSPVPSTTQSTITIPIYHAINNHHSHLPCNQQSCTRPHHLEASNHFPLNKSPRITCHHVCVYIYIYINIKYIYMSIGETIKRCSCGFGASRDRWD